MVVETSVEKCEENEDVGNVNGLPGLARRRRRRRRRHVCLIGTIYHGTWDPYYDQVNAVDENIVWEESIWNFGDNSPKS